MLVVNRKGLHRVLEVTVPLTSTTTDTRSGLCLLSKALHLSRGRIAKSTNMEATSS
jgi:hypothetical protein